MFFFSADAKVADLFGFKLISIYELRFFEKAGNNKFHQQLLSSLEFLVLFYGNVEAY